MRKIDEAELNKILSNHKLWLMDESNGIRADLSGVDLEYADLDGADLRDANLGGADLRDADLRGADLRGACLWNADLSGADLGYADLGGANLGGADLSGADLSGADLGGANLGHANLYDADFSGADLGYADLGGADLRDADLRNADLRGANLGHANLRYADLRCANLSDADLGGANLWSTDLSCVKNIFFPMACPEKGSFIAFKKAGCYIIELFIPSNAKRCSATSRKCRCSKAKVISITTPSGDKTNITEVHSNYDPSFIYKLGEYVEVKNFDDNRWNECSTGIHFFITRQEAVEY